MFLHQYGEKNMLKCTPRFIQFDYKNKNYNN